MRKKLEYWWTYHKGIVIFAVVLAAAVLYVAGTMGKKEKTQILMGEVVNNVQDDAVTTRMEEAILAGIGGDPNGEEVVVDTALTMDAAALGQTPIADANTPGFPRNDHDVRVCARARLHDSGKRCV